MWDLSQGMGFLLLGGNVMFINRVRWGANFSMAARSHTPSSLSPHPLTPSPTLSVVQPSPLSAFQHSPLATRSFGSYSFSSSPLSPSQVFLVTRTRSSPSPDFFGDFTYSEDMDKDFCRIDSDAAAIIEAEQIQAGHESSAG